MQVYPNPTQLKATDDSTLLAGPSVETNIPLVLASGQFCLRLNSTLLQKEGFAINDLVIVDAQKEIKNRSIVVVNVDGELLLRKLEINGDQKTLFAQEPIAALAWQEGRMEILGVVVYLLRSI